MKRLPLLVAILGWMLAPLACCTGEARVVPDAWTEPVLIDEAFALPNGLDVELVHGPCGDRSAVVLVFDVGTDHDPAGRSGLMRVIERLFPAGEGGQLEMGSDHTMYSAVVANEALPGAIDDLARRIAGLEITEADLGRARAEVLTEIERRHGSDAAATARTLAAEAIQPTRGNGRRGGVAAEVEAIELAELMTFWRAHFAQSNAHLVVTGDYDPPTLRARLETAFAAIPAGTPPTLREDTGATVIGTLVMGDAPTQIALAVPAPPVSDPLYPAFLVLAARLLAAPAEPRSWEARYDPLAERETLYVTAPVPEGRPPEPTAGIVRAELATLVAQPLDDGDVAAAEERFGLWLGGHALDPETCAADPRALAIARARRPSFGTQLETAAALATVTQEQLDHAATLFAPSRTTAVIAGGVIR